MKTTRRAEIISIEQGTASKLNQKPSDKKEKTLPVAAKRYDLPCLYQG